MIRSRKLITRTLVALPLLLVHASAQQTSAPGVAQKLTVTVAEQVALKNNPTISVAKLIASSRHEVVREVRSALLPTAMANLTAVDTDPGNRISAGGLNNPVIYERAAYGATVAQLITDFGRTSNVVSGTRLHALAEDQNALATANQIKIAVDRAFYRALSASSVLRVARQTVDSRQLLADQVGTLAQNKLRSTLDVSFANANLEQARLLLIDAENQYEATLAELTELLGVPSDQVLELVDDSGNVAPPPSDLSQLVSLAMGQRPEVKAQDFQLQAAKKFESAAWEQNLPSIRALGAVGQAPIRDNHIPSWYGAVGVNVEIPIFTGFRISAQTHEARLQTEAEDQRLVGVRNIVIRDVRTSWLAANTAYLRIRVTAALLDQTKLALDLSQARYKLGLASIIEVSQAQLQETEAEIAGARARYDYLLAQSIIRFETGSN